MANNPVAPNIALLAALFALGSAVAARPARADAKLVGLIQETGRVLDTLAPADPEYAEVQQKLADFLFEEVIDLEKEPNPSSERDALMSQYRKKAISLYLSARERVDASDRVKMEFQLARLYADDGDLARAREFWLKVYRQPSQDRLRREAALRLAEDSERNSRARAETESLYKEALRLGADSEAFVSYASYRYAWFLFNNQRTVEATALLKNLIWDPHARVREEVARDWVLMLGHLPDDGSQGIRELDPVARRLNRPELFRALSDSYYSSGNGIAGTRVLALVDSRAPDAKLKVRLLEQYVGFRQWSSFREQLRALPTVTGSQAQLDSDSEKIMRRLSVQLDGERKTDPERAGDFKNLVLLYLKLFPATPERERMIEGWLAAEPEPRARMEQLLSWINQLGTSNRVDTRVAPLSKEEIHLREVCADAAQKAGKPEIVAEVMGVLAQRTTDRRYRYIYARALYETKNYAWALPIFQSLAVVAPNASGARARPDEWAIKSQNLALDILAQQKNYGEVQRSAAQWASNPALASEAKADPTLKHEIAEIAEIGRKAQFQKAVSDGNTPGALAVFLEDCESKLMLPQSCENAKVLASRLKDESALIRTLKATGATDELAAEYEAAGYFAEAADMNAARLKAASGSREAIRVALLYDLAGKPQRRNQTLKSALAPRVVADFNKNEELWASTLRDAGLLSPSSLDYPFSKQYAARIADELEESGQANEATREALMAAETYPGLAWTRVVMDELKRLDREQAKIGLTGRQSRKHFVRRSALLKDLADRSRKFLDVADGATRVEIANLMMNTYDGFAKDILASPIPPGLGADDVAQIKAALDTMAAPFKSQGHEALELAKTELAKIKDPAALARLSAMLSNESVPTTQAAPSPAVVPVAARIQAAQSSRASQELLTQLHRNPEDRTVLAELSDLYRQAGAARVAAYFDGRLKSVSETGSKQ